MTCCPAGRTAIRPKNANPSAKNRVCFVMITPEILFETFRQERGLWTEWALRGDGPP